MKIEPQQKVLVVEDHLGFQAMILKGLIRVLEISEDQVLQAFTLAEGKKLFDDNRGKIIAVLMDGCVDQDATYGSGPLSVEISQSGFEGLIIAISGSEKGRSLMVEKYGCTHQSEKGKVPLFLQSILELA